MGRIPFALRRLWLLVLGTSTNRDAPRLALLDATDDPEEFVWAMLPHAARTFAPPILLLPERQARAAAIAYLYCRMLDTYEDLHPDPSGKIEALSAFVTRFQSRPPAPAPVLPPRVDTDQRDAAHRLLVRRYERVDAAFNLLAAADRANIVDLVESMGAGMTITARTMETAGGVLRTPAELEQYCHAVIGEPVLFALRLTGQAPIPATERRHALDVSVMIQLANVTRDIEKDLERGVAYHPSLEPFLGAPPGPESATAVRKVREELMLVALKKAPAYRRLLEDLQLSRFSSARAAAVLMLQFTDRYFRSCARRVGRPAWPGPSSTPLLVASAALAGVSPKWASRVVERVEANFLAAAG